MNTPIEVYLSLLLAIISAFLGGLIAVYTKEEIKKYFKQISAFKEVIIFAIGLILLIINERPIYIALTIFAFGAATTTILNKFWLGKYNRMFELALLGLILGGVFNINLTFAFLITSLIVIYNLIAESLTIEPLLSKKAEYDFKMIAITQMALLVGFLFSFILFTATKVIPTAFIIYVSGALIFLVFEPGKNKELAIKMNKRKISRKK